MTSLTEEHIEAPQVKSRYFQKNYFKKLFSSGGKIFVICVPYCYSLSSTSSENQVSNYWWSPITLKIEEESGDTFKEIVEPYKRYFSVVKSWKFTFMTFIFNYLPVLEVSISWLSLPVNLQELAKNRYGAILAAKIIYKSGSGEFCFLPPPTEVSSREGVNILLEDFFDVKTPEQAEPDWAREIKVPGGEKMDDNIQKALGKIEEEKQRITEWKQEKKKIARFKKLLYAKSDELEKIVHSTFREFGAEVIYPKEKNKEDGRIVTKYGKGVLEIKKDSKSASRRDTRQLDDWVGNCIAKGEKCKGILVINHYGNKPLSERKEPFPSDVIEHAKEARPGNPFCLLTTVELFNAYCAFKKGEIDADTIFKKIFKAEGKCKLLE